MANLKITLKKSLISEKPKARGTVQTLGLRKIGQSVVRPDRPEVRGAIRRVQHLVTVEEVN